MYYIATKYNIIILLTHLFRVSITGLLSSIDSEYDLLVVNNARYC